MFSSERAGARNLYWQAADGTGAVERLTESPNTQNAGTVSPDGTRLTFTELAPKTGADVMQVGLDGTHRVTPLVQTPFAERNGIISPDGRWLAYVSNESGTPEVYVRPFPNTGDGRWQISVQGGQEPIWAHSGRELFYRTASGAIPQQMAIEILPGPTFTTGERRTLFPLTRFLLGASHQQYAVAPGDQRFVMIRFTGSERADQLVVVENFFEELKRIVPR